VLIDYREQFSYRSRVSSRSFAFASFSLIKRTGSSAKKRCVTAGALWQTLTPLILPLLSASCNNVDSPWAQITKKNYGESRSPCLRPLVGGKLVHEFSIHFNMISYCANTVHNKFNPSCAKIHFDHHCFKEFSFNPVICHTLYSYQPSLLQTPHCQFLLFI
jgi:hypothetical protein